MLYIVDKHFTMVDFMGICIQIAIPPLYKNAGYHQIMDNVSKCIVNIVYFTLTGNQYRCAYII